MKCPRCENLTLVELDRDGITIDRCERCRGIWLDRGELDKLLVGARAEERRLRPDDPDRHDRHDPDDDDDHDERRGRRRRSFWDIFD